MKILILCGGKGLRLRPITEDIPKPMVYVGEKPLLEHVMGYFAQKKYTDFVLAIGYKGDVIKDYIKKNDHGWKVEFSDAGDVDIIGRIKAAKNLLSDRFIVVYGDTIANVDINDLVSFHKNTGGMVTITTFPLRISFGLVYSDSQFKVTSFREKPVLNQWMNIGFMVFENKALDLITPGDNMVTFLEKVVNAGQLYEYKHTGKHITINDTVEKEAAENQLKEFYTLGGV
jgi:glucose-1-phosphate cytidylyltransferase